MESQQSGSAPFRSHARLIRLLGEELISDETVAVVELVKNSYDADARHVTVWLEDIATPERGTIRIVDDGYGMSLDTLLYKWLEPANSSKRSHTGLRTQTPNGRKQLGEKGIGRFAADKLGRNLELITRGASEENETILHINWSDYDQNSYLDEVNNTWMRRTPEYFSGECYGTAVIVNDLRSRWDRSMLFRLHEGLTRLISPFASTTDFTIEIQCGDFPEFNGPVTNRLLDSAPYRLIGEVNSEGLLITGSEMPETIDLRKLTSDHFGDQVGGLRPTLCGPFKLDLNVWDLDATTGKTSGINASLRRMIRARSGISIYRDNFRVLPYGEKDDDWLELNQRRVNNPTLRVSNNQVIGLIEITYDGNPQLRDRTSREGFLEGPAVDDFRVLVVAALSLLEQERFARRHADKSASTPASPNKDDIVLQSLRQAKGKSDNSGILVELERLYLEKLEDERTRYAQVIRLAGLGMAAEAMTDTFGQQVNTATLLVKTLMDTLGNSVDNSALTLLAHLESRMDSLNEQLDLMQPLYRPLEDQSEYSTIYSVVYDVFSMASARLRENKVQVQIKEDTRWSVHMNPGHLMQVFIILLENSLAALKHARIASPQIRVDITSDNGTHNIYWSDNGPGVPINVQNLLFRPHFSTRRAGRGLGLSVARDILMLYGGSIGLSHARSDLPGACFEIQFDGRRIRKSR